MKKRLQPFFEWLLMLCNLPLGWVFLYFLQLTVPLWTSDELGPLADGMFTFIFMGTACGLVGIVDYLAIWLRQKQARKPVWRYIIPLFLIGAAVYLLQNGFLFSK